MLERREEAAITAVLQEVLASVSAELVRMILFGSRARGEARPDSDLDLLLIFRELSPDREPQASQAEAIAEDVAARTDVPVATWSVSLSDLHVGVRTPMLVDALADGLVLWPAGASPLQVPFTPPDARFCAGQLLDRVAEGSVEVAESLRAGSITAAAERARDDIVRLCTAALLLRGETRPRHAQAVRRFAAVRDLHRPLPPPVVAVLSWAADSFGSNGRGEELRVPPPPAGWPAVRRTVTLLRQDVVEAAHSGTLFLAELGTHNGSEAY